MVQISHPYMTTGKTIALSLQTFVGKVISLLFNTLSRSVIAFPHNFMASVPVTVILESEKIKFVTASTFPLSICHEMMGSDDLILVF